MIFFFLNRYYREEGSVVEEGSRRQQRQSFLLSITERQEGRSHMSDLVVMSFGVFLFGFFFFISLELKTTHLQDDSLCLTKASLTHKHVK